MNTRGSMLRFSENQEAPRRPKGLSHGEPFFERIVCLRRNGKEFRPHVGPGIVVEEKDDLGKFRAPHFNQRGVFGNDCGQGTEALVLGGAVRIFFGSKKNSATPIWSSVSELSAGTNWRSQGVLEFAVEQKAAI